MRLLKFLGSITCAGCLFLGGCSLWGQDSSTAGPDGGSAAVLQLTGAYDTLDGMVLLAWKAPSGGAPAGYEVLRAEDPGGGMVTLARVAGTAYADTAYPGDRATGAHLLDTVTYRFTYTVRVVGAEDQPVAEAVTVAAVPPRLARPRLSLAWSLPRTDSASIGDSLTAILAFGNIAGAKSVDWHLGSEGAPIGVSSLDAGAHSGTAAFTVAWTDEGDKVLHAVLRDGRGNSWRDSLGVSVVRDLPLAHAGRDFEALTNSSVRLSAHGEDRFGSIVGWEWKIGREGDFRRAGAGDTVITTPSAGTILPCVLRVTDDDGGIALDTAWITVSKVMVASPRPHEMLPDRYTAEGTADPAVSLVRVQVGDAVPVAASGRGEWKAALDLGSLHPADQARIVITASEDGDTVFRREITVRLAGDRPYWELVGGDGSNRSWDGGIPEMEEIRVLHEFQGRLYAALVSNAVDKKGQVWRFDGEAWELVGGSGVRGSWPDGQVMSANALTSDGRYLYAGTGIHQGQAHVWRFDGTAWERIGGDGLNGSWGSDLDCVWHLGMHGGQVHAGLVGEDVGIQRAPIYRFDGGKWHLLTGEAGERNGWGRDEGYVMSYVSVSDGTSLYVGLAGRDPSNGRVFRYDGATFQQIGGDGLNGSWSNPSVKFVEDAIFHGDRLHVTLNGTYREGRREPPIWSLDGGSWNPVGDVPREWEDEGCFIYNKLHSFRGELHLGVGGRAHATSLWKLRNDGTWTKVGGQGLAGSDWNASGPLGHTLWIYTMATFQDELYIGLASAETRGMAQVWRYRVNR